MPTEINPATEIPTAVAPEAEAGAAPAKVEKVETEAKAPVEPVEPAKDATAATAPEDETTPAPAPEAAPATASEPAVKSEPEAAPVAKEAAPPELVNKQWGTISAQLATLYRKLPEILEKGNGHTEVFGVPLVHDDTNTPAFSTLLILQKFLRANEGNVEKAVDQLTASLVWRSEMKPLDQLAAEHDREAFEGLGYVQVLTLNNEVLTWNIYGAVKDYKKTFGDLDKFLKWRVALMEAAIAKLNLAEADKPIPDYNQGPDPYQISQVHDYLNISFIRMDPHARAASKAAIQIFRDYYPEMLNRKFFVNVPLVMGWLFKATALFLPETTLKKFRVLSYGTELHKEISDEVPENYGGKGIKELKDLGDPVRLTGDKVPGTYATPTDFPPAQPDAEVNTAPDTAA
ncbi:Non-classical phosphatidylinositol transfer protein (PITP) [Orbilia brochopaga]|uniref:Phosphatidylinositol transfer protein SFH5 n=1 Tax=Orbilia brochopaga TaxID=3140254 RepID=A0AAV9VEU6_9PEZI